MTLTITLRDSRLVRFLTSNPQTPSAGHIAVKFSTWPSIYWPVIPGASQR